MNRPRVVITGMGAITPLGLSLSETWKNFLAGRSGVRRITQFDASSMPCQIAGEVQDYDPTVYLEKKEARRMSRVAQIAFGAAIMAMQDAGLENGAPDPLRSGVMLGTAFGGLDRVDEGIQTLRTGGVAKVNPFVLPTAIPNFPAFLIAKQFQCLNTNGTLTTACAAGTQSVGEAAELIRRGKVDLVIAGGAESVIKDFAIGGFCAMRALPVNYNDCPEAASRPFDARREGFIYSEGAGFLVLENLEQAQKRGARIYAEVAGQAASCDAFHMAAPDPDGAGPIRSMRWSLEDAGIGPEEVDYINAHGTSTPLNDETETRAIKAVLGEQAYRAAISSTKSMIGHAMGASGSIEAIVCAKVIETGWIPPTINYETPDPACDLDYTPNYARQRNVKVALSNSFGLGGQNACLVLRRYSQNQESK